MSRTLVGNGIEDLKAMFEDVASERAGRALLPYKPSTFERAVADVEASGGRLTPRGRHNLLRVVDIELLQPTQKEHRPIDSNSTMRDAGLLEFAGFPREEELLKALLLWWKRWHYGRNFGLGQAGAKAWQVMTK